jgi:Na+-transporting methylmalonyl-CoA/oxaloacetate decarboxylase gamma subunit
MKEVFHMFVLGVGVVVGIVTLLVVWTVPYLIGAVAVVWVLRLMGVL